VVGEPGQGPRPGGAGARLAAALRRLRRARGLSQRALTRPLHLNAHSAIADYEAGRRIPPADVLRDYERFFGLAPGALLSQRGQAIAERAALEDSPGPGSAPGRTSPPGRAAHPVPRQLPAVPACFVGRGEALAALDVLLPPARAPGGASRPVPGGAPRPAGAPGPAPGVVVVSGMGGVGKTALAVWWAHRARAAFPAGTLYVNLQGYDPQARPLRPAAALEGFLRALGVATERIPYHAAERAALFRTLTAGRRILLVLDNARDAEQVRPLLPGTGAARAIVTSRDRLAGLIVREGAVPVVLDVLAPAAAAALIQAVAGLPVPGEGAREVARLCGRLPLALRLAAERIARDPAEGLAKTLAELSDPGARLASLGIDEDPASTVQRVLAWSYDALPGPAQFLLRRLGQVSVPELDGRAAAALAGMDPAATGRHLDALADGSLVVASGGRYSLHDLVRCFARERAARQDPAAERDAAVARLTAWYLHSACHARAALAPQLPPLLPRVAPPKAEPASFGSAEQALAWYEAERRSLVAATRLAFDHALDTVAWQLATALYGFFELRKYWNDWVETHQIALRAAQRVGDGEAEGRIWCNLGNAYRPRHQFDEAIDCYRRALELFRLAGYRQGEGKALGNLGTTVHAMGRYAEAIEYQRQALACFREIGDGYGTALTLTNLGEVFCSAGKLDDAMTAHAGALEKFRQEQDAEGEGRALSGGGKALAAAGEHAAALDRHERAALLFEAVGNRLEQAYALADMMAARFALGEPAAAAAHGQRAAGLLAELGLDAAAGQVLADLAVVLTAAGDPGRAAECRREAAQARRQASAAERDAARRLAPRLVSPRG
jgi:tetratricopeptide (TPR) repeat protein